MVLVGRSPEKLERAAEAVRAAGASEVETVVADYESLDSVRAAAQEIRRLCPRIDVLVNNAGTVYASRTLTGDGQEATFQVNHLSGFLLTEELKDVLVEQRAVADREHRVDRALSRDDGLRRPRVRAGLLGDEGLQPVQAGQRAVHAEPGRRAGRHRGHGQRAAPRCGRHRHLVRRRRGSPGRCWRSPSASCAARPRAAPTSPTSRSAPRSRAATGGYYDDDQLKEPSELAAGRRCRGTAARGQREPGGGGMSTAATSAAAGPRGRTHVPRRGLRRRGRDLRRGGVQHRHDRLPGDADRPVVPPAGRGDDGAAHRQHRRQRRGPGEPQDLGRRLRRPRPRPAGRAAGAPVAPSTTSCATRASSASPASTPGR